jgi:hypothetical protein
MAVSLVELTDGTMDGCMGDVMVDSWMGDGFVEEWMVGWMNG